jgi:predicted nucleotidyltransferase
MAKRIKVPEGKVRIATFDTRHPRGSMKLANATVDTAVYDKIFLMIIRNEVDPKPEVPKNENT